MAHHKSAAELQQELLEQAEALRASAAAYDGGALWEAKRLAVTAYMLLHDGGRNSKSLLGQLGLKGPMMSTALSGDSSPLPLAVVTLDFKPGGKGMTFKPFLDEHSSQRRIIPFSKWYEESVFSNGRLNLSRKNLIFTLRDQAGGAHVDKKITDEAFQWLRVNSTIHISTGPPMVQLDADGNEVVCPPELEKITAPLDGPVPNGHLASMRQIAWEIDRFLESKGY